MAPLSDIAAVSNITLISV